MNKYIEKYKRIPLPIKATLWFSICNILQKGIVVLTVPIFTRVLTTQQYGLSSVYQSWQGVIAIFATLSLSAGVYNKGLIKYDNDREAFTSSLQGLSFVITVALFVLYMCFSKAINEIIGLKTNYVTILMIAMFIELIVSPSINFWSAKQRFDYKYRALIILTLMISIATPVVGLFAVSITTYKGEARILSAILVNVIICSNIYLYNLYKGKKFFVKKYWVYALKFNLPLIPHYLSQIILNQSDRIMINYYCGIDKAGIYGVAYNAGMMMMLVTNGVNSSFIPWSFKAIQEKRFRTLDDVSKGILMIVAIFTLGLTALAPEIIMILAPKEYYEAIWIIPPVSASVFFLFIYNLFGNIEMYYEKTKLIMLASVGAAIANIILNYYCLQKFGYLAAGYTTLICYIFLCIIHYFFMRKVIKEKLDLKYVYDIKYIIAVSVVVLVVSFLLMICYHFIVIRYCIIIILIGSIFLNRNRILNIFAKMKNN